MYGSYILLQRNKSNKIQPPSVVIIFSQKDGVLTSKTREDIILE